MSYLYLAGVPKTDEILIVHEFVNPFASASIVHGVLSKKHIAQTDGATETIRALFRNNGSDGYPLLASLPTYILLMETSPYEERFLHDCFHMASDHAHPENLERTTLRLQEFRGNPWERTPVSTVFFGGSDDVLEWPPSVSVFSRWWDTVTSGDHVSSELPHMRIAWEGAIKFQADMGNKGMAAHAMRWDEASSHMGRVLGL